MKVHRVIIIGLFLFCSTQFAYITASQSKTAAEKAPKSLFDKEGKTALHRAVINDDVKNVKVLSNQNAYIDAKDKSEKTALIYAIEKGNLEMVKILIENGANISPKNAGLYYPLTTAIEKKQNDIAKLLINRGAAPSLSMGIQDLPLYEAARMSNKEICELLLSKGADVNQASCPPELLINQPKICNGPTPLHAAASSANIEIAKIFIRHGANLNAVSDSNMTPAGQAIDEINDPSCHCENEKCTKGPSKEDYLKFYEFLLQNGAKRDFLAEMLLGNTVEMKKLLANNPKLLESPLYFSRNALQTAIEKTNPKIVEFLINNGADVNYVDKDNNCPPLGRAVEKGDFPLVKLLVSKGADVNKFCDNNNGTPLMECITADKPARMQIFNFLLDNGADMNLAVNSETPLQAAISGSSANPIAKELIRRGANVQPSGSRYSPLHAASQTGNNEIAKMLLDRGADPNARDNEGETPLEWDSKNIEIARLLIENGADANSRDNDGKTPLMKAESPDLVEFLISKGANVNLKDKSGETAFTMAVSENNAEKANILAKSGAEVDANFKDKDGLTLLQKTQNPEIASVLISKGADVNATTDRGYTPLHFLACRTCFMCDKDDLPMQKLSDDSQKMAQELIDHGAHINAVDSYGRTPLAIARSFKNEPVQKVLEQNGGTINNNRSIAEKVLAQERQAKNPIVGRESEDYRVYEAVIKDMYIEDWTVQLVISRDTYPDLFWGSTAGDLKQREYVRSHLPSLQDETISNFSMQNGQKYSLGPYFNLKLKYTLLNEFGHDKYFGPCGGSYPLFYRDYHNSTGIISFSRVGYNSKKDQALLETDFSRDMLWGGGYYIVLKKIKGKWVISEKCMTWIS